MNVEDSDIDLSKRIHSLFNKAFVFILIGSLLIAIGAIVPSTYDLWGDPHGFMNSPEVGLPLIAICIVIIILAAYSEMNSNRRNSKRIMIALLILSILFLLASTVFVIAWTVAIIDREVSFGPGLYIVFIGTVFLLVGSIMGVRKPDGKNNRVTPIKTMLVIVAVLAALFLTGYAAIGVHSYIVPRRMLDEIEEHLDHKDFLAAYDQLITLGTQFPECPQVEHAQIKYEEAALNYVLEHVDALDDDLPPTVFDCIQGIDYQAYLYEENFMAAYNDTDRSIYINVNPLYITTIDDSLLHEWGHAYSIAYLDQQEIIQYKNLRGIPDEAPWLEDYITEEGDYDDEVLSISAGEDFAEVFRVVIGNGTWSDTTIYGEVENPEQMRAWIIDASMQ